MCNTRKRRVWAVGAGLASVSIIFHRICSMSRRIPSCRSISCAYMMFSRLCLCAVLCVVETEVEGVASPTRPALRRHRCTNRESIASRTKRPCCESADTPRTNADSSRRDQAAVRFAPDASGTVRASASRLALRTPAAAASLATALSIRERAYTESHATRQSAMPPKKAESVKKEGSGKPATSSSSGSSSGSSGSSGKTATIEHCKS